MSVPLIALVGVIYLAVAVSEFYGGRPGIAVVYAAYALANVGFIWEMSK